VPELHCHIGLVGTLVLGEAYVSVDPEERAAKGPRVCHKVWANSSKLGPSVFDESEAGCEDILFITLLVLLKPYSVIVSRQAPQKLEEFRREVRPA